MSVPGSSIGIVRLLVACLGIAILGGCRKQPSETVFLDPALAVLVPADTTLLAGIRMQRVRATPFYDAAVANAPRLAEFRKSAGLMDDSDVWEYLIASNGREWIALLRGKFTEMGMEPRVNKPSGQRLTFEGVSILGDEDGAIAFLNPTTAIAGKLTAVKHAVEQRNHNSGVPEGLVSLASQIPSHYEAWLVSTGPLPAIFGRDTVRSARVAFDPRSKELDLLVEANSGALTSTIPGSQLPGSQLKDGLTSYRGPAPAEILDWMLGGETKVSDPRLH